MSLLSLLKRLRIFHPFNLVEVSDAETENVLRDHGLAMSRLESTVDSIKQAQGKLRETIQISKTASESVQKSPDPMAVFLHDMRSSRHHQTRN